MTPSEKTIKYFEHLAKTPLLDTATFLTAIGLLLLTILTLQQNELTIPRILAGMAMTTLAGLLVLISHLITMAKADLKDQTKKD